MILYDILYDIYIYYMIHMKIKNNKTLFNSRN